MRTGWLTALLALALLVCAPGAIPALGDDGAGGGSAEAFLLSLERSDPGDRQLLMLARKLIQGGRCDHALIALDRYFSNRDRDRGFELEAEALSETCRPASPPSGGWRAPAAAPPHRPAARGGRLNAVQVFVFSAPGTEGLSEELAALKRQGVDTIIVRSFHNSGDRPLIKGVPVSGPGVYFPTAQAPVSADILGTIVGEAHTLGLRVFGWINTRRSDWLIERHPEWLEWQYDFSLGRSVPSRSLSIFQGGVREKLGSLMGDLAGTGVDGILFQDDLIMRYSEGFSSLAGQTFLMETGRGIHPDDLYQIDSPGSKPSGFKPLFWEWSRWKTRSLMGFLDELLARAREVKPDLLVAANIYYESVLSPEQGLAWYAQDIGEMLNHPVDYLALMSYHRQMISELSLGEDQFQALLSRFIGNAKGLAIDESRIIFKIQTLDWETNSVIPEAEWEAIRDRILAAGRFSIALLRTERR